MSAGLPGVGLSGLFFIASALLMLPLEIVRTLRGTSSWRRWSVVFRNLAIAIAMLVALELSYLILHLALEHLGLLGGSRVVGGSRPGAGLAVPPQQPSGQHFAIHTLPVAPILATLGLIACLLCAAKVAHLVSRRPRLHRPSATLRRLIAQSNDTPA